MKRPTHLTTRRASRGLTLVELLVSLAIGLILMIAIVSAYLGSAAATRVAEAQGRMNEDAQAALGLLSQQIRMAGFNPRQPNYQTPTRNQAFTSTDFAIRGCDNTFTNITTATTLDNTAMPCTSSATAPDSFVVRYEADTANTIASGGVPTDCLGQALPARTGVGVIKWNGVAAVLAVPQPTYYVAENRFYIGTTTTVVSPSLFCKGNGGTSAQPLVENIEDMQILYGTAPATATSSLTVAGYLTATSVVTDANLAALSDDQTRWGKVVSARVCIVVRSEGPVAPDSSSARYNDCSGTLVTAPDLRLRRAYSTTVVLRNRIAS